MIQQLLLCKLIWALHVKPYESRQHAVSDALNDFFLVLAHMCQFLVSPFVPDNTLRNEFGFYYNSVVFTSFLANCVVIVTVLMLKVQKKLYLHQLKARKKAVFK